MRGRNTGGGFWHLKQQEGGGRRGVTNCWGGRGVGHKPNSPKRYKNKLICTFPVIWLPETYDIVGLRAALEVKIDSRYGSRRWRPGFSARTSYYKVSKYALPSLSWQIWCKAYSAITFSLSGKKLESIYQIYLKHIFEASLEYFFFISSNYKCCCWSGVFMAKRTG